jgi:hypothetical protein
MRLACKEYDQMKSRTFQKGSGCFNCASCGRLTRHTTSDNPEICGPCYELAGFENGVTDNGIDQIAGYLSDAVSYYQEITSKGGKYEFTQSPELGAAVLAAIQPKMVFVGMEEAVAKTVAARKAAKGYTINITNDPNCEPRATWTIARNSEISNVYATMYTLYWRGLVRGQLVGYTNALTICEALNAAKVDGSEIGEAGTQLVAG